MPPRLAFGLLTIRRYHCPFYIISYEFIKPYLIRTIFFEKIPTTFKNIFLKHKPNAMAILDALKEG